MGQTDLPDWDERTNGYFEQIKENHDIHDIFGHSGAPQIRSLVEDDGGEVLDTYALSLDEYNREFEVYKYESGKSGRTVWAVTHTVRAGIDEIGTKNILFTSEPSKGDIKSAMELDEAKQAFTWDGLESEFDCWECGQHTHWLDISNPNEPGKLSLSERVEQAQREYCGC